MAEIPEVMGKAETYLSTGGMMGKTPPLPFDVQAWISDPQLKMASFSTKGIWIDLLCFMWKAPERGKLIGTIQEMGKLIGATDDEMRSFIDEADKFHFCTIERLCDAECYGNVTLINRRMNNNWKDKELSKLRMRRMRGGIECYDNVTDDVTDLFAGDDDLRKENREEKKVTQRKEEYKRKEECVYIRAREENQEKKLFLECVFLFDSQYQALVKKYGQHLTDQSISILNNYIMSKEKDPYKSHYHVIIGWPMERAGEKYGRGTRIGAGGSGIQNTPPEWVPEAPISEEQRAANIARVKALTGGDG